VWVTTPSRAAQVDASTFQAQRRVGAADRPRSAGDLAAEQRVAVELGVGRRLDQLDLGDVHLELFGDQHRHGRERALAHLDLVHHEVDDAFRVDADEAVGCEARRLGSDAGGGLADRGFRRNGPLGRLHRIRGEGVVEEGGQRVGGDEATAGCGADLEEAAAAGRGHVGQRRVGGDREGVEDLHAHACAFFMLPIAATLIAALMRV
jgi:hypothetical protein